MTTVPPDRPLSGLDREMTAAEPVRSSEATVTAFTSKRHNEWTKAKDSFGSILDEAGEAMRVFDLEKRRILGLTHALTQIEQSFESLHLRFGEMEKTIAGFTGERKRLEQRIDDALAVVRDCEENEADLMKDNAALRAAITQTERRLGQYADGIATLTEENRRLRERLAATERDNGLIVDEIARIRNELIAINEKGEFVGVTAPADRPTVATAPGAQQTELVSLIADLQASLEKHKKEFGQLKAQIDFEPIQPAANDALERPSQRPPEMRSQAGSRRHEPLPAYPDLTDDGSFDHAYPAPSEHISPYGDQGAPRDPVEPSEFGPHSRESVDVNALCSIFERRSMELRAELAREQKDRKLAEHALQAAQNERAQLNRELARLRAKAGRAASPEVTDPPAPPPPSPSKREISAA